MIPNAHGAKSSNDGLTIDAIPIADQVAGRLFPRESLGDMVRHPLGGRVARNSEAQEAPPFVVQDQHAV